MQHICELGTLLESLSPIEKEVFLLNVNFVTLSTKCGLKR